MSRIKNLGKYADGISGRDCPTFKHGHSAGGVVSSEYSAWNQMIQRCENKRVANFLNYGGRGIRVCDRWKESFQHFISDMGNKPSLEHSIDRINNDGNYEPSNCRWATRSQQAFNRRRKTGCFSDFIGVSFDKRRNRFRSYIGLKGKRYFCGHFKTEIEAAIAYDIKSIEEYGRAANVNFKQ